MIDLARSGSMPPRGSIALSLTSHGVSDQRSSRARHPWSLKPRRACQRPAEAFTKKCAIDVASCREAREAPDGEPGDGLASYREANEAPVVPGGRKATDETPDTLLATEAQPVQKQKFLGQNESGPAVRWCRRDEGAPLQ
jgi:hypothetical protein